MAEVLKSLSQDLANIVEKASGAIVRVDARRRFPASGVVLSAGAGTIVTAHHVVQREGKVKVGLADGSEIAAEFAGRDPTTDLALLKVSGAELADPAWKTSEALKVGNMVLAVGRPGARVQATLGIVSALGDIWRTPAGGQVDRYLQTDVVMYPGFSGGALIGAGGSLLGVNSSGLLRGISVTVPTETVQRVASDLEKHGRVRRGFLGVAAQPAELPKDIAEELGRESGLLLVTVEPDSPAQAGGLALGDTIVAFDGEPVEGLEDLLSRLSGDRIGADVELTILRGGKLSKLNVTVGDRAER
jgi:S1-C subfamily serine protease